MQSVAAVQASTQRYRYQFDKEDRVRIPNFMRYLSFFMDLIFILTFEFSSYFQLGIVEIVSQFIKAIKVITRSIYD